MLKKSRLLLSFAAISTIAAASIPTVACSFAKVEVVGGKLIHTCEIGESGSDENSWRLERNGKQVTGVAYKIEKLSDWNADGTISIDKNGKVSWTAFENKGTYRFCVVAASEDIEARSEPIVLDIVESSGRSAEITDGTPLMRVLQGDSEEVSETWKMKIEDVEVQTPVTWSLDTITPAVDPEAIKISDGKVTVDATNLEVGEYQTQVIGTTTIAGKDVTAKANLTVVIYLEDEYEVSGGTTSLNLSLGETSADTNPWVLKLNGHEITEGVNYTIAQYQSETKPDFIGMNASHCVTWTNATNTVNGKFVVRATYKSTNYDSKPITVNVENPIWSISISGANEAVVQTKTTYSYDVTHRSGYEPTITWSVTKMDGTSLPGWIDAQTGDLTIPSSVLSVADTPGIKVIATATVSYTSGTPATLSAEKIVIVRTPAHNSTDTFVYDNLDNTANAWWKLTNPATSQFTKVGSTATAALTATSNPIVIFGDSKEVIDTKFLEICKESFDNTIEVPTHSYKIGDDFLEGFTAFNKPFFPMNWNKCTAIGKSFMYGCEAFNQQILLSELIVSIGPDFMVNCYSSTVVVVMCPVSVFNTDSDMTLTVDKKDCPAFTTGKLVVDDGFVQLDDFKGLFPEITDTPDLGYYRHYFEEI